MQHLFFSRNIVPVGLNQSGEFDHFFGVVFPHPRASELVQNFDGVIFEVSGCVSEDVLVG